MRNDARLGDLVRDSRVVGRHGRTRSGADGGERPSHRALGRRVVLAVAALYYFFVHRQIRAARAGRGNP